MADISVGFHGLAERRSQLRQAEEAARIIRENEGFRPRRVRHPSAHLRRARDCPSGVAFWVRVGGQEVYYRLNGCFSIPAGVHCWLYPCGTTDPTFDQRLLNLAGEEIEIHVRRDEGGPTRFLMVTLFDPYNPRDEGTEIWAGSADAVSQSGGQLIQHRRRPWFGSLRVQIPAAQVATP